MPKERILPIRGICVSVAVPPDFTSIDAWSAVDGSAVDESWPTLSAAFG